ncbi:MAG: tetratricopeptide repeat protein [Rhodothermales bacterium]
MHRYIPLILIAGCIAPGPLTVHPTPEGPMPVLTKALGPFTRPASTVPEAQAYFDQGVQMMYAFASDEAPTSFQEAWKRDPDCAMCYWGEAWSWGPYLNGPMENDDAPHAYTAAREAVKRRDSVTGADRALIDAMAVRYAPSHDTDERKRLDTLYAETLRGVYEQYPEDLETGTLYAEALMLLEPRRGRWNAEDPDIRRIHAVLEDVLARDIRHPGACHLYIHATESTSVPQKAEICTDYLGNAIPGASHINHMPSHTYNRVGRWGEAVRANIQAWHSDQKAAIGEGFAIYPSHNLHMLLFAASMDGQGAVAIQAGKDIAKLGDTFRFFEPLALLRFGRFDEILTLKSAPPQPIPRALWEFAQGYAQLRTGDLAGARDRLSRLDRAIASTPNTSTFRGHTADKLVGAVRSILAGEILRSEGRLDEAIATFERGIALEDSLIYDEPEPLNFAVRHWLGAALLEAGRPTDAERVYREALADHPNNGWCLFGLAEALRAQGRTAEAEEAQTAFEAAWARSDTWIRASRF